MQGVHQDFNSADPCDLKMLRQLTEEYITLSIFIACSLFSRLGWLDCVLEVFVSHYEFWGCHGVHH